MPLLSFLQKKSKQHSLPSSTSSNDDDYVNVSIPSPLSEYHHLPASSSRLGLPFRNKRQDTSKSKDPLLEPPPRQSSLFQAYQDHHHDHHPGTSTQSLPTHVEKRQLRPEPTPQQRPNTASKKSRFAWNSKQKAPPAVPSAPPSNGPPPDDTSFNLKSFRHIRPDSPSYAKPTVGRNTPTPPPRPPIPTTTLPGRESSFQVTSRRPRGNSTATNISLSNSTIATAIPAAVPGVSSTHAPTLTQSQQKIAVAAFRQAARKSAASLSASDSSPRLSPIRTSFDDRLSVPALSSNDSNDRSGTPAGTAPRRPPRSQPPGPGPGPAARPAMGAPKSMSTAKAVPVKTGNAFGDSDDSDTSDDNDDDDESGVEGSKPNNVLPMVRDLVPRPAPSRLPAGPPLTLVERDSFASKLGIPQLDLGSELSTSLYGDFFASPVERPDPVRTWTPPIPVKPRTESYPTSDSTLKNSKRNNFLDADVARDSLAGSVKSQPQQERSATTDSIPRPPSSLSVYSNGARKRASLSVGALDPSAQEARASVLSIANSRLSIASTAVLGNTNSGGDTAETSSSGTAANRTEPTSRPLNSTFSRTTQARRSRADSADSDTSESSSSSSSSDDAPLSKLVPPRRPGTTLSSHSDSSPARRSIPLLQTNSSSSLPPSNSASSVLGGSGRKPLIDLSAPSSMTGRPMGVPPPPSREEETSGTGSARKSRLSIDTGISSNTARPVNPRSSMANDISPISPTSSKPNINARLQSVAANVKTTNNHPQSGRAQPYISLSPPTTNPRVSPPMPPFLRRESPASSIGDSSSGKAPYTPRDGSRPASIVSASVGGGSSGRDRESRVGHKKKPSVTFEDEMDGTVTVRGRGGKVGVDKGREKEKVSGREGKDRAGAGGSGKVTTNEEEKRKERRRSEARAAIELGKVVNGPPPVDPDDEPLQVTGNSPGMMMSMGMQSGGGANGTWPPQMQMLTPGGMHATMLSPQAMQMLSPHPQMQQMQMQMQMMPMMNPMMNNVSPMMLGAQPNAFPFPGASGPSTPDGSTSMQMSYQHVQQSGQSMTPVQNNDAFLAAHQQAMAIAKQTFQMAVAQQALAAANDEWERGSAMTGFGGGSQWGGGMSMAMAPPTGMQMFPSAPRSMYAGSMGGGGGGGGWGGTGSGGGWGGTGSVYGGTFGPQASAGSPGFRNSQMLADRNGARQRTKTAPSSQNPPRVNGGHGVAGKKPPPPPSSYKGTR